MCQQNNILNITLKHLHIHISVCSFLNNPPYKGGTHMFRHTLYSSNGDWLCVKHQPCPVVTPYREGSDLHWVHSLVCLNYNGTQVWGDVYEKFVNLMTKRGESFLITGVGRCINCLESGWKLWTLLPQTCASALSVCMYTTPPAPNKYTPHGPGWIPSSEIILYWTHVTLETWKRWPRPRRCREGQGSLQKGVDGPAGTRPPHVSPGRVSC